MASAGIRTNAIVIEPLSIDFGAVRLGSEKSTTLSIQNNTSEDFN